MKTKNEIGYDCEGYSIETGIHKNSKIRRYFHPRIDTPITDQEIKLLEKMKIADKKLFAWQDRCKHQMEVLSHEESECNICGHIEFYPDI